MKLNVPCQMLQLQYIYLLSNFQKVHLNVERKPSIRIRFYSKTEIFFSGLAFCPHVSSENGHRKHIFPKCSQRGDISRRCFVVLVQTDENIVFWKRWGQNVGSRLVRAIDNTTPLWRSISFCFGPDFVYDRCDVRAICIDDSNIQNVRQCMRKYGNFSKCHNSKRS